MNVVSSVVLLLLLPPAPPLQPRTENWRHERRTHMTFPPHPAMFSALQKVRQDTGGHVTIVDAFVVIVPARVD